MRYGGLLICVIVILLIGSARAFAAVPSISESMPASGEEVRPPSADHSKTTQKAPAARGKDFVEQAEEGEEEAVRIADPIYPWNKAMYHFNDKLYFWVLKPAARGYSYVFPEDIRSAVSNFFYNITTPIRFVSDILQFKIKDAGNELVRLAYNSTAGVCGLVDAAKADFGISRHDEDLGQTFGSYGIGHGFYIIWPVIGPSSLRDTVGLVGDTFLNPVYYINPWEVSLEIEAYDEVNNISLHIGDYEDLKEAAVDPYVSIRDAYAQHRKKQVEE